MDVLNFQNATQAYNNLEQYQSEKQQQIKELVQQYREGAEQAILPAIELYQKGKNFLSSTPETPAAPASLPEAITENLPESLSSTVRNVADNFSSSIRNIGDNLATRMRTNAFERDPESDLASNDTNMSMFDRAQSLFRGGESSVSNVAENVASGVSNVAADVAETAGRTAASVIGESIGTIASEAIPVVGELGMLGLGIYDFVKSFSEKAPEAEAFAAPVFEKGIQ